MSLNRQALLALVGAASTTLAADPKPAPSTTDKAVKTVQKEATEARNYLNEAMVNARVRAALLKNLQGADGARVKVDVNGSAVTLSGEVQERASMKLADEVAKSVEGVKSVSNQVKLSAGAAQKDGLEARMKDSLLESEIRVRLLRDVGEAGLKVELEAADGVVSVRGKVVSAQKKDEILKSIRAVVGVRDVKDLLSAP